MAPLFLNVVGWGNGNLARPSASILYKSGCGIAKNKDFQELIEKP
jgi:hypothetical protein